MFRDVDSTIVKDVCMMMVDSCIEFLCGVRAREKKEKKGKVTHPTIPQTNKHIIARNTWIPSLENLGGVLNIFCGSPTLLTHPSVPNSHSSTCIQTNTNSLKT